MVGRPTTYDPSYCESVVEWGRAGKSLTWMASELDVHRDTLYAWRDQYEDFSDALTRAKIHSQRWWEDAGQMGMEADKFNANVWSRSMAARFPEEWREKTMLGSDPEAPLPPGLVVHFAKTDAAG